MEGELSDPRWLDAKIGKHFTVKAKYLGPEEGSSTDGRLFNRSIRLEAGGITWEPDARHVKMFLDQPQLPPESLTSVPAPAVKTIW